MMAWIALLILFSAFPALAVQQPPEERVVVTANATPVPFENLSRAVTVLTREDIRNLPVHSIADILALTTSADIRSRSPFGLQGDISIRGSAFSQILVLVDGVRMNDSQTAHHNTDFPVQLQDIERVEVLLGPGSSIYGADAFGGVVNIITRREADPARASISAGQDGFIGGSFSTGFHRGGAQQSISASGSRSSGFQYDREFRDVAVSGRTGFGNRSSLFVSYVNKEFGANGFYGPLPSREWTNQTFVSFERRWIGRSDTGSIIQGYFRTHGDRFILDIRTPDTAANSHRSYSTGAIIKTNYRLTDAGTVTLGGEVGSDWITSNTLGDHSFARMSLFTELRWLFGKAITIYPGLRFDYYSNFGSAMNPSLSGSWWVLPRLRLRSSVGRAFRIPTFTELYYTIPHYYEARDSLKPESAWSTELGADFIPAKNWLGFLTLYSRQERNVIDWIRLSTADPWRTDNIRKLHTIGAEIGLERSLGSRGRITMQYGRISTDAGRIDYESKYVLDYARDSWSASTWFPIPFRFGYKQNLAFKKRADGRSYWLMDGRLERRFQRFTAALDFMNLLNTHYQEVKDVDMPGRWFGICLHTQ
jgi:outer membrane cobalamin receptor